MITKNKIHPIWIFCILFLLNTSNLNSQSIIYPKTFEDKTIIDNYHGIDIEDPFRWLEDDHSSKTKDWVKRQNDVTFQYLDNIPFKKQVAERLAELYDYKRVSAPFKEGEYYYFYKNDGLQNQSVLYRSKAMDGEGVVVLDPNTFSKDGTTSLGGISFNKKGNLLAYSISEGGSDWRTAYVLDLKTMKLLEDEVKWIKFSGLSWSSDGFYYSRYPSPEENDKLSGENKFHKVYFHKLGTKQDEDKLIIESKEHPNRNFYAGTSENEDLLIISPVESTSGNSLYVQDLTKESSPIIKLVDNFNNDFSVIDYEDGIIKVLTNYNAPNKKIISIDLKNSSEENWMDLIPETKDKLSGVSIIGGKIFINYLQNASSLVKVFDLKGNYLQDLKLPGIGTVGNISGKKADTEAFFNFTSFIQPNSYYLLDVNSLSYTLYKKSEVKFDTSPYTTEQVWFTSKDGTKVPMFLTYRKGIKLDGQNPTLLYGYGGFDISITPSFSVSRIPLLESGGIYAVANIRGGGEFGSEWHKAGTLERKQNVFDDFQAAAEYLIEKKYTSSKKLAIEGRSNGGLLVGACMTQRPDLYAVAFPGVGVLDMLRYHQFTIGWAWATDYGRSDDKESFEYLIKYSPLHNVQETSYPATMVFTADHDDRVVPAHSFKFIAELQKKHQGNNPVLIRIDTSAGHGAGKPISKIIEEEADKIAFMLYNMDEKYSVEKE